MNRITGTHRLLDGYAEPSRVRRLKDHQQRQQAGCVAATSSVG
jgi:hypothetical protein